MVEIGGKPILWHIMKLYSHHGFTDFVLCLGYKGDVIRQYFLNYHLMNSDVRVKLGTNQLEPLEMFHDERDWSVVLAETGPGTLTAGRLRQAARYVDGGRFLVGYRHDGYWFAMDTIREKRILEDEWASGRAPWKVW